MKKIILLILLIGLTISGIFIYQDICESSPECACKDAAPDDPTCSN